MRDSDPVTESDANPMDPAEAPAGHTQGRECDNDCNEAEDEEGAF